MFADIRRRLPKESRLYSCRPGRLTDGMLLACENYQITGLAPHIDVDTLEAVFTIRGVRQHEIRRDAQPPWRRS